MRVTVGFNCVVNLSMYCYFVDKLLHEKKFTKYYYDNENERIIGSRIRGSRNYIIAFANNTNYCSCCWCKISCILYAYECPVKSIVHNAIFLALTGKNAGFGLSKIVILLS